MNAGYRIGSFGGGGVFVFLLVPCAIFALVRVTYIIGNFKTMELTLSILTLARDGHRTAFSKNRKPDWMRYSWNKKNRLHRVFSPGFYRLTETRLNRFFVVQHP